MVAVSLVDARSDSLRLLRTKVSLTMPYATKAKAVLALTTKARRLWLDAYSKHVALDDVALRNIITLQKAVDAARAAVEDEEERVLKK